MQLKFRFGLSAFFLFSVYLYYSIPSTNSDNSEHNSFDNGKATEKPKETLRNVNSVNSIVEFEPVRTPISFKNTKKVLIYSATKFFKMDVTTERFLSNCHSTKGYCRISEDPADLEKADAVLFHNADFKGSTIPMTRKANRPHVLWSLESQKNDVFQTGPGFINWTMTPSLHSEIWMPYGHTEVRPTNVSLPLDDIWVMKTENKTATWLASNCHTPNRRKFVINALANGGIESDLFGRCGKPAPNCAGVVKQGYPCVRELIRKYKFYYALENSNCPDYITEKFWASLYDRYTVPIVLERKKYEAIGAPPNSFVAIDDFQTLREVEEHVNKVAKSKEEYLKYHEWRNTHVVFEEYDDRTGFCELCRVLQSPTLKYNVYNDFSSFRSSQCNDHYGDRFLSKP